MTSPWDYLSRQYGNQGPRAAQIDQNRGGQPQAPSPWQQLAQQFQTSQQQGTPFDRTPAAIAMSQRRAPEIRPTVTGPPGVAPKVFRGWSPGMATRTWGRGQNKFGQAYGAEYAAPGSMTPYPVSTTPYQGRR